MTLIIFDCDGTLIDSEMLHAETETDLIRDKLGLHHDTSDHNRRFVGLGRHHLLSELEKEFGRALPDGFDEELTRRKREAFAQRLRPVPHILETLQQLADMPRCVASNELYETLLVSLQVTGLYDLFVPHIFSAQMVARGKPFPDLFLYAAQKMGAEPKDCVVVEDSAPGVQAALAAGMRVIGYLGGAHCYPGYAERLQGVEAIIDDMRELPRLIQSPINPANKGAYT